MLISSEQNNSHQILLNRVLYDRFKLIYAYLNEGDKVLKKSDTSPFTSLITIFFIKRTSLN